jgi:hypothetical protein
MIRRSIIYAPGAAKQMDAYYSTDAGGQLVLVHSLPQVVLWNNALSTKGAYAAAATNSFVIAAIPRVLISFNHVTPYVSQSIDYKMTDNTVYFNDGLLDRPPTDAPSKFLSGTSFVPWVHPKLAKEVNFE